MRRHPRFSVEVVTATVLGFGLILSGCARAGTGSADQQSVVAGQRPAAYHPADQQQSRTCDGVAPPSPLELIPRDAVITDVAICPEPVEKYVAGQGSFGFLVVRTLPAAKFSALMAGLTLPDASGTANTCSASLSVVTDFTITLADGSRIRPGVPGDGCHPRNDALKAFAGLSSMPIRSERRGAQARTELEITTGCEATGKSVAVWAEVGDTTGLPALSLPSGSIIICRYRNETHQQGPLAAAGIPSRTAALAAWPTPPDVTRATCTPPADIITGPVIDWVTIRRVPTKPYRFDGTGSELLALVELGGCRRLVTPRSDVVGSLDQAHVDALAALADTAVG